MCENKRRIRLIYEQEVHSYDMEAKIREDQYYKERIEAVFDLIDMNRTSWIVDIGCGDGILLSALSDHPQLFALGVDIAAGRTKKAKKRISAKGFKGNIEFIVGDAESLPISKAKFDTVICSEVIEHVLNPGKLISEISKILKKGGEVIISTPNLLSFYTIVDTVRRWVISRIRKIICAITGVVDYTRPHGAFSIWYFKRAFERNNLRITNSSKTRLRFFPYKGISVPIGVKNGKIIKKTIPILPKPLNHLKSTLSEIVVQRGGKKLVKRFGDTLLVKGIKMTNQRI